MSELLPARTVEEVEAAYPVFRQSLLGSFDRCPLAVRFALEGYPFNSPEAARGIVFHLFMEKYLATIRETRERNMPASEAIEVLREAEAQLDVPDDEFVHVPTSERELLRICAVMISGKMLSSERIVAIEERLFTTIAYESAQGRVERVVSGKPDVLIADPPDGVVVPDWKTTRSPPPAPAAKDSGKNDPQSEEGWFQQRLYALLIWRNYPQVERVILREWYVPAGESRDATLHRWKDAEHVEREVAATVQELDRALAGGHDSKLWSPSPGRHCRYCPRPMSCPVDRLDRPFPAPLTDEEALRWAGEYLKVDRRRTWLREALRTHATANGPIPVVSEKGDYELRWRIDSAGRRNFGLWPAEGKEAA